MNHGLERLADKTSIAYQLYAQHERMVEEILERERWEKNETRDHQQSAEEGIGGDRR